MHIDVKAILRKGLVLVVPLLLLAAAPSGGGPTGPLFPNPVLGVWAGGIVVGDFDEDGKPDLAISDQGHGAVVIEPGRGDVTFEPERRYPAGAFPRQLVAGDFNGDGHQDLAVVDESLSPVVSPGEISILLGLGDGSFAPQSRLAVGDGPRGITIGDFNGDGRQDLAVINVCSAGNDCATGEISVLIGAGDGTFAPATSYPAAVEPISIVSADFNGDGHLDLIAGSTNTHYPATPSELSLLLGNGDGTFGPEIPTGAPYSGSGPIAVGDFNADGRPDLAVSSFKGNSITIFIGQGNGTFQERSLISGRKPFGIEIGDFNGDGHQDVATADQQSDDVSVFLGHGDGTFASKISVAAGNGAEVLAFGDLDVDGTLDLLVGNDISQTVLIRTGNGDGSFGAGARQLDSFDVHGVALADFNRDGRPDLVVPYDEQGAPVPIGDLSVLLGNGDGTFGSELHLGESTARGSAVSGDFNGDGKPDFAVGMRRRGNTSVFLGRGDGTFGAEMLFAVGSDPAEMASGDLNGDGVPDLVVVNQAQYYPSVAGDLSILIGRGDGTFAPEIRLTAGSGPVFVTLADYNGDGRADLAVVNDDSIGDSIPGYVLIFLGRGDGTFTSGARLEAGPGAFNAVARDFNGDGRLDLAVNNRGALLYCSDWCGGDLSLLLGNGDGTFQPQVRLSTGDSPLVLLAADVDGDGNVDLVSANVSFDVSLLFGHGDGTFAEPARFGIQGFPQALAAADIDGDDLIDLAGIGFSALTVLPQRPPPNSPPHASIFTAATVECTGPAGGVVRLDGTGSTDVDSTPGTNDDIVSFEWFENPGRGETALGSGRVLSTTLPIGVHVLGLVVTDSKGATDAAQITATVQDTTPPQLTLTLSPAVLWPPNHRMVPVRAAWQVSDVCDPATQTVLVSATSSEPDDAPGNGDGSTAGDIQDASTGTADSMVLLRSERAGGGPGRVYTLTYAAADASGNRASALGIVSVPQDRGTGPEPVMLSVEGGGTHATAHLYWNTVGEAEMYDVIQGDLSRVSQSNGKIWLGPVHVLASGQPGASYSEGPDGAMPAPGGAFFYLVQYRQGQSASGWGTESSPWPAEPSSCDIGCPGEPLVSSAGSITMKRK